MATLGTGVIILIVIWIITLATLTLFTFSQSSIRYVGLLALLIAVIVTLILTLIPRGDVSRILGSSTTPTSLAGLPRILILTFLCVTFVVGLIILFVQEVVPPVYAQPVRKRFIR
ncbi:unnamed protein product [Rotaria sp. Silwood1]|nr:unnamed protein product [Rotaria sp. Silwood1]CAF3454253.1 unnamed protein product [Rotaria sp. Silwood1]CAF3725806.1 unnamed protein product [Rotaria sp. Silwood1]CAF4752955.1 unnamed protein product [Rotaria sp. Silwood1]CAF4898641.1 unnamed protein product [Rotaria sp. Silwood1]